MSDSVEGLKQRLVGAFVILVLAVIFLPMVFDKSQQTNSAKVVPIPPKPDFQSVTIKRPTKPELDRLEVDPADNKVKPSSEHAAAKAKAALSATKTKPVPAAKSEASQPAKTAKKVVAAKSEPTKPVAVRPAPAKSSATKPSSAKPASSVKHLPAFKNVWMVQLGTFSNKANAYKLRDKLRKDGFGVHTKAVTLNGKRSVRVFAGPFVSKREAAKIKKKLDAKFKVKSVVRFFEA